MFELCHLEFLGIWLRVGGSCPPTLLVHLYISTRADFRALLAARAEIQLDLVGLSPGEGFHDRIILAEAPTGAAIEALAAAHAPLRFGNRLVLLGRFTTSNGERDNRDRGKNIAKLHR